MHFLKKVHLVHDEKYLYFMEEAWVSPSFTFWAPEGISEGGYCSRRSGYASSLDAFHLPPILLTQALFTLCRIRRSAKFWGAVHWVFPSGRAPLRRRDMQLIRSYILRDMFQFRVGYTRSRRRRFSPLRAVGISLPLRLGLGARERATSCVSR